MRYQITVLPSDTDFENENAVEASMVYLNPRADLLDAIKAATSVLGEGVVAIKDLETLDESGHPKCLFLSDDDVLLPL